MIDNWLIQPPRPSDLGDRQVPLLGQHLQGKRIALLVTGSIAALKAPLVARALRREGAEVVAFVSSEGLRYTTVDALEWSTVNPVVTRLTAAAEHLSDGQAFDAYLVAPATYNTINKFRYGTADGVVTSTLASALGRLEQGQTQILLAPTMHGSLHNRILHESLQHLRSLGIGLISPRDDYGKHNLPEERVIAVALCRALSDSPLRQVPILVTGGPTPVPIDNVRRLTNRFTGRLGIAIAEELVLRGADVQLIHGLGPAKPPDYLPYRLASTYEQYLDLVSQTLAERPYRFGIFSAAVADYQPRQVLPGKTPSGGVLSQIELVPTKKVISQIKAQFPDLEMVTFKYQENVTHETLMAIAAERIQQGHSLVVANRGEEVSDTGEQIAYLVSADQPPQKMVGKPQIAQMICDHLAALVTQLPLAGSDEEWQNQD